MLDGPLTPTAPALPVTTQANPNSAAPRCAADDGSWCARVYDLTGNDSVARAADTVVDSGLSILFILVVAIMLRAVVHRTINNLTSRIGAHPGETRRLSVLRRGPRRDPEDPASSGLLGSGGRPEHTERRLQRARTVASLFRSIASALIWGIAFVMVLSELGIDVGPIIASAGVLGLAIGFGAQNLVRDFLSGIFMMLEDQYGVGDTIDVGEANGDVEAIGLRTTTIRDIEGTVWYVRNGEIQRVGNYSQGHAIALVDIPLAHSADVAQASDLAEEAARAVAARRESDVLGEPSVLGVQDVTPYAVTLRITVKVRPGRQWSVQRAMNEAIKSAWNTAGIPAPAIGAAL